jgi:NADH-ubiquinone oxidoreductase chain 3
VFFLGIFVFIGFFIVALLKVVSYFLAERSILMREELTSYECGFEHHSLSRIPFSFRYFFLTLVFLLFDLEVILLLFIVFLVFSTSVYFGLVVCLGFC